MTKESWKTQMHWSSHMTSSLYRFSSLYKDVKMCLWWELHWNRILYFWCCLLVSLNCGLGLFIIQHQVINNTEKFQLSKIHFIRVWDYVLLVSLPANDPSSSPCFFSQSVSRLLLLVVIQFLSPSPRQKRSSLKSPARWRGRSAGVVRASSIAAMSFSWMY